MTTLVSDYWHATTPTQEKREDGYALIADLYREGLGFDAIQERLGCGRGMIDRALTAHNVERRPKHKLKGVKNRSQTVIRKRNAQREAQKRVDCVRCGWPTSRGASRACARSAVRTWRGAWCMAARIGTRLSDGARQ